MWQLISPKYILLSEQNKIVNYLFLYWLEYRGHNKEIPKCRGLHVSDRIWVSRADWQLCSGRLSWDSAHLTDARSAVPHPSTSQREEEKSAESQQCPFQWVTWKTCPSAPLPLARLSLRDHKESREMWPPANYPCSQEHLDVVFSS
jgi:hypothetical protein